MTLTNAERKFLAMLVRDHIKTTPLPKPAIAKLEAFAVRLADTPLPDMKDSAMWDYLTGKRDDLPY